MILKIQAYTGKIDDRFDTSLFQFLGVADTTSLQNQWRRQGAARNNDLLASSEGTGLLLLGGTRINNVGGQVWRYLRMGGVVSLEQFSLQPPCHPPL